MDLYVINLAICGRCEHVAAPFRPFDHCPRGGGSMAHHAVGGTCPLQKHRANGEAAGDPPASAPGNPFNGSALWAELHRRPLVATAPLETERDWLNGFTASLPCGQCKPGWRELLKSNPPRLSSREDYARWTWEMHNAVNKKLGKDEMAWDAAAAMHGWSAIEPPSIEARSPQEEASGDK